MWKLPSAPLAPFTTAKLRNANKPSKNNPKGPIHELRIEGLKPATQYFYRTTSKAKGDEGPQSLTSEVRTFQTASPPGTPFAFAVISDTQGNPKVSGVSRKDGLGTSPQLSSCIPGDLVSTGGVTPEWIDQFFASMEPLVSRVPF